MSWHKQHSKGRRLFTSTLNLNLRNILVKCYTWSIALYGAETWTLEKVDQKYLKSFKMWFCRRMEKIIWTYSVRNEVLHTVKGIKIILHIIKRRMANWIGHVLRRNCLLKHIIKGNVKGAKEVKRKQERSKQILDDLQAKRGYWILKRGSNRSRPVENSMWNRLRKYRKTDYRINEWIFLTEKWRNNFIYILE